MSIQPTPPHRKENLGRSSLVGSNPDTKTLFFNLFFLLLGGCRIASCVRAGRVESCREAVSTPGYLAPPLLSSHLLPPSLNLPVR